MATYIKIASNTVGAGGVASVTFSSIPQTYTNLVIKTSVRGTVASSADSLLMSFNSSTTSYTIKQLEGNGSAASSNSTTNYYGGNYTGATATAGAFASNDIFISNYTSANYKSYSFETAAEWNNANIYMDMAACLWSNTAAITSITFLPSTANFAQYSTFTLYGISNA